MRLLSLVLPMWGLQIVTALLCLQAGVRLTPAMMLTAAVGLGWIAFWHWLMRW